MHKATKLWIIIDWHFFLRAFFYSFGRIEFHQILSYMDIYSIEADVIKIPWLFKSQKNQEVSVPHLSSKRTAISWLDNHRFGATSLSNILPNVKLFLMQIIIIPTPAQVGASQQRRLVFIEGDWAPKTPPHSIQLCSKPYMLYIFVLLNSWCVSFMNIIHRI